jgi:hypothetical protein
MQPPACAGCYTLRLCRRFNLRLASAIVSSGQTGDQPLASVEYRTLRLAPAANFQLPPSIESFGSTPCPVSGLRRTSNPSAQPTINFQLIRILIFRLPRTTCARLASVSCLPATPVRITSGLRRNLYRPAKLIDGCPAFTGCAIFRLGWRLTPAFLRTLLRLACAGRSTFGFRRVSCPLAQPAVDFRLSSDFGPFGSALDQPLTPYCVISFLTISQVNCCRIFRPGS